MKIKGIKQKVLHNLGNIFLHSIINVLCKSVKIEKINSVEVHELLKLNQNFVLAFWHGTMLIPWYVHRNQNFSALVSLSKDGSLLANTLLKWGFKVERGSSHKGGKEALNILLENCKQKYSVAITPDGPTGPPREMKAGAVITAQRSNLPLILCGVAYKKKYIFNSWDKFEIPKFFSNVVIKYSEPVYISAELSRDETSKEIIRCNALLNQLQNDVEKIS
ncbi:MAG: lysophospholipid acyltransferase family protein [Bacteroidetes bacterium]|nr:lysophospholipid acyltransferase family protein [Bacteroidota bacterium]MBU1114832.1 lysophospholipid acyltransferase family protein [Bacteroidota bacterium]MBU1799979.1 lysophospholipid acyltransferase family protein [Bacteroidota bacterium]